MNYDPYKSMYNTKAIVNTKYYQAQRKGANAFDENCFRNF